MPNRLSRSNYSKISLFVGALLSANSLFAEDYYEIIDLGVLDGSTSESFSINDSNEIVGYVNGPLFAAHAYVYRDADRQMVDLGHLEFERTTTDASGNEQVIESGRSFASGINNNGLAAGYSTQNAQINVDSEGEPINADIDFGVIFNTQTLTVTPLPQIDAEKATVTKALTINNNDLAVGFTQYNPPNDVDSSGDSLETFFERGFIFDVSTQEMTIVNPLNNDDSQNTSIRDINDNGLAVGVSTRNLDSQLSHQAIMVDASTPEAVEIIEIFGGITNYPWAINNSGKVVGVARNDNTSQNAFIYDTQTELATNLGHLNDSFRASEAIDINNSDQVVGRSKYKNIPVTYHAFIYENGVMKDLNNHIACDSGWQLIEARSINNAADGAVITGYGIVDGQKHAFMLKPLAGTAPACVDEDDSSGSGSVPFGALFLLILAPLFRKQRN